MTCFSTPQKGHLGWGVGEGGCHWAAGPGTQWRVEGKSPVPTPREPTQSTEMATQHDMAQVSPKG
jgi:hypothetical protein